MRYIDGQATISEVADEPWQPAALDRERWGALEALFIARVTHVSHTTQMSGGYIRSRTKRTWHSVRIVNP